jgi:hypothetical protein
MLGKDGASSALAARDIGEFAPAVARRAQHAGQQRGELAIAVEHVEARLRRAALARHLRDRARRAFRCCRRAMRSRRRRSRSPAPARPPPTGRGVRPPPHRIRSYRNTKAGPLPVNAVMRSIVESSARIDGLAELRSSSAVEGGLVVGVAERSRTPTRPRRSARRGSAGCEPVPARRGKRAARSASDTPARIESRWTLIRRRERGRISATSPSCCGFMPSMIQSATPP